MGRDRAVPTLLLALFFGSFDPLSCPRTSARAAGARAAFSARLGARVRASPRARLGLGGPKPARQGGSKSRAQAGRNPRAKAGQIRAPRRAETRAPKRVKIARQGGPFNRTHKRACPRSPRSHVRERICSLMRTHTHRPARERARTHEHGQTHKLLVERGEKLSMLQVCVCARARTAGVLFEPRDQMRARVTGLC